jgi:hypothetical protein
MNLRAAGVTDTALGVVVSATADIPTVLLA